MKLIAKLAFGVVACALLFSGVAAVLSPKAVYAIVATIIRDQDNPARHPFVTSCVGVSGVNFVCNTPGIPAGQEVVIETVSVSGFNVSGSVFLPTLQTTAAGVTQSYDLNPAFVISTSAFQEVQSLRLYADPGTVIRCEVTSDASLLNAIVECKISGYFVTLP